MKLRELEIRRAQLEHQILQDRLDISHSARDWLEATAPMDRGWQKVARYKGVILAGASLATAWRARRNRRHERKGIARHLRKGILAYTMFKRARGLLSR